MYQPHQFILQSGKAPWKRFAKLTPDLLSTNSLGKNGRITNYNIFARTGSTKFLKPYPTTCGDPTNAKLEQ